MTSKIAKSNQLKYLEPAISVIFWLLLFASPLLFGNSEDGIDWDHITNIWRSFAPYLFLFLLNRFVFLPYLFFRGRRWLYFTSNLIMVLIVAAGVHFYRTWVLEPEFRDRRRELRAQRPVAPPVHRENRPPPQREGRPGPEPPPGQPPKQLPPFLSFAMVSVLIIGFDTGLVLSVKWARSEQKRIRLEKENVENQLAFLRTQVSPHFFMNTLNNIHSLIDYDSNKAKDSIIKLSKLMRHLLYDSEGEQIPLKKELEFVRNYVELMKLRFSNRINIRLDITGQIPEKTIPPLLFTSFVENAFKHGIQVQGPSFVSIAFGFEKDLLLFSVKNSNQGQKEESESAGIGIENSRRRLDLLYGDRYSLEIHEGSKEYMLNLSLPL